MLKKILIVLCVLLLTGCRPTSDSLSNEATYSVLSINKIPSLVLLNVYDDVDLNLSDNLDDINNAFDNKTYDVIIAPLVTGVNKLNEGSSYKLLSIVEYDKYYIAVLDETFKRGNVAIYGDEVLGKLVEYLSKDLVSYNFVWYDSFDEIYNGFKDGSIEAALINENDYLYLNDYNDVSLYKLEDVSALYESESTYSNIPTYGMFVLSDIVDNDQDNLTSFTKKIKSGVSQCKNDKTTLTNILSNIDLNEFGIDNSNLVSEHYSEIGVDFTYAVNDFDSIKNILSLCGIDISEKMIVK